MTEPKPRTGNIVDAVKDCLDTGAEWRRDRCSRRIRRAGYCDEAWAVYEDGHGAVLKKGDIEATWTRVEPPPPKPKVKPLRCGPNTIIPEREVTGALVEDWRRLYAVAMKAADVFRRSPLEEPTSFLEAATELGVMLHEMGLLKPGEGE